MKEHILIKYEEFIITGRGTVFSINMVDNKIESISKDDLVIAIDGSKWLVTAIESFAGSSTKPNYNIGLVVTKINSPYDGLYLPFYLSLIAKELGFNEPCFKIYHGDNELQGIGLSQYEVNSQRIRSITAPLYQQITTWLLIKGILITPDFLADNKIFYKLKCVDWNYEDYTAHETINDAIESAFKLLNKPKINEI